MYSTRNEGTSVVGEKFIRTLRIKFLIAWLQYQKMCTLIN